MTDKQKLKEAESLLRTFRQDAKMAIKGTWDKSNEGFQAQIEAIDRYFNKPLTPSRFKQTKLDI